jgi:hypothetical protein
MSLAEQFREKALAAIAADPERFEESTDEDLVEAARRSFFEGVRRFEDYGEDAS